MDKAYYFVIKMFLIVLVLGICTANTPPHPLHVSITEAHYRSKTNQLELTVKFFYDDLERALKKSEGKAIPLCTDSNENASLFIKRYLNDRFVMQINDKDVTFEFIGIECKDDVLLTYLRYNNLSRIKKIALKNATITEVYPDQTNIFHYHHTSGIKSIITNMDQENGMIDLKND